MAMKTDSHETNMKHEVNKEKKNFGLNCLDSKLVFHLKLLYG